MNLFKKIYRYLSRPAILHYLLPILILYLLVGTIAQKYIGLYEATQIFFSSPIMWLGPLPLPGLPLFMGVIFLSLCLKLIFKSPWNFQNSGIVVIHIGALLLLLGGLFTALSSTDGYIELSQGGQKNFVTDYHDRDFTIRDEQGASLQSFAHKGLTPGDVLSFDGFTLTIIEACRHCSIQKRAPDGGAYFGMAQHMQLSPGVLRHQDEDNMAGVTFALSGTVQDGHYLALENVNQFPEIVFEGHKYIFSLQKEQRPLPFTIELLEFSRDMHPGTAMAKAYSSRVLIKDGEKRWESLISMNEPLRYKGYTFFQASFIQGPNGDASVLTVVRNVGRIFPYISGIAICLGLLLHLYVRQKKSPKKGAQA